MERLLLHPALKARRVPLRSPQIAQLHTTSARNATPFFQLAALSHARETQHFSKRSGRSVVDHVPNLQLIKSSEVIPFASQISSDDTKAKSVDDSDSTSKAQVIASTGDSEELSNAAVANNEDVHAILGAEPPEIREELELDMWKEQLRIHDREMEELDRHIRKVHETYDTQIKRLSEKHEKEEPGPKSPSYNLMKKAHASFNTQAKWLSEKREFLAKKRESLLDNALGVRYDINEKPGDSIVVQPQETLKARETFSRERLLETEELQTARQALDDDMVHVPKPRAVRQGFFKILKWTFIAGIIGTVAGIVKSQPKSDSISNGHLSYGLARSSKDVLEHASMHDQRSPPSSLLPSLISSSTSTSEPSISSNAKTPPPAPNTVSQSSWSSWLWRS